MSAIIPFELLTVTSIAIFMAISPRPDFAIVSRNSIMQSKSSGIYMALGITAAICLHVSYSIAGIASLIAKPILLFSIIKYIGVGYLLYSGYKTFTAKSQFIGTDLPSNDSYSSSKFQSFKSGLITNALNPKTTIFFLSIFSQLVTTKTPLALQLLYGAIISVAHLLWFYLVAVFFSHPLVLGKFQKFQKQIQRVVGTSLMVFGLKVAFTKLE